MGKNTGYFQIFVDTGGTFTDCIGIDQNGKEYRQKVLSNSSLRGKIIRKISTNQFLIKEKWNLEKDILSGFSFRLLENDYSDIKIISYDHSSNILEINRALDTTNEFVDLNFEITSHEEAPVLGIRLITQTGLNDKFPDLILKLGSTKGTNALLERKGAKTLLIITKGFKDLLKIGTQSRPDIFAMNVIKRKQLTTKVIEVNERIDKDGNIIQPIDLNDVKKKLGTLNESFESVAVALMNAYKNPVHENQLKKMLFEEGCKFVSTSAELSPLIKLLPRTETTVTNAYLFPVIYNYIDNINKYIGDQSFQIMTSAGNIVAANNFQPKDSLLSGPAGGVVGASIIARQSNINHIITFDMGGTSTDVSRYNGDFDYRYELNVGDSVINSSAIAIETVAAGGGSICGFDGYRLFVGPESASADPGPACYGAGGPLTITDVNLLLGRLDTSSFGIPVYIEAARNRLKELINEIQLKTEKKQDPDLVLKGFLDIANEIMAGAIRKISIAKGYNPKEFALTAFGGAGGLHACDIAEILGIESIILPQDAGLLSAYGIGNAGIERFAEMQILQEMKKDISFLHEKFKEIEIKAKENLLNEGFNEDQLFVRQRMIFLRLKGQDSSLEIDYNTESNIIEEFHNKYEKLYGHKVFNRPIEVDAIRVIASLKQDRKTGNIKPFKTYYPEPVHYLEMNQTPVFTREDLNAGAEITGKALFLDKYATTYIKENWKLTLQNNGSALIKYQKKKNMQHKSQTQETELELFANRFMSIAENMGALLQRTALSVNIKERLDFSCALLDKNGRLIANAPHIPVHLGGLGVCVQSLLENFSFKDGDTLVTNHPGFGGSHLPDVTMVTPVYYRKKRIAFVVNRAHHSEIGGISPGSMPPDAKNLQEEGVVISPFYLIKNGKVNWEGMREILTGSPYPSRSTEENMADLNAAIAANIHGKNAVIELIHHHGIETVFKYFNLLRDHATKKMKDRLNKFANGTYTAVEKLDDGSPLKVLVNLKNGRCHIDFTGSADINSGNMNATKAIVYSVVIYVLRLLLNEPIPLNDGLLEPVTINLPYGMLNPEFDANPAKCPAVVGGNVEISMRLTDTLLKAFGVMAASQGTMNNILFGNNKFGYYETICGGCGAGNGFHGASAVHHHMTNTRITDPEIMEHRYPVRIDEFSIRENSGGNGKWKGGDGVIRKITFLEPVNLSVLTQRRNSGPYGLKGGNDGKPGEQQFIRKDGSQEKLRSIQNIDLKEGDSFIIKTPGGGGYG